MPPNPRLAGGRVELIGRLRREGARTHPDQATCGVPQTQEPHSGHTKRVLTRPLSAVRWSRRGSIPLRRRALSPTTTPIEKALLVKRWHSVQWQV